MPWIGELESVLSDKFQVRIHSMQDVKKDGEGVFWRKFASTINFVQISIYEENDLYSLDWDKSAWSWGKNLVYLQNVFPKIGRYIITFLIWLFRNAQKLRQISSWAKTELDKSEADIFILMPVNMAGSLESELLRAAKKYGIPTLVPIMTLDNLTSKGIHFEIASKFVVWNEIQHAIMIEDHRISKNNIDIIGSLFFDSWYKEAKKVNELLIQDKSKFKVLYVCSSSRIGNSRNLHQPKYTNEYNAIIELIQDLEIIAETQGLVAELMIREHPSNKLDSRIYQYTSASLNVLIDSGEFPNEVQEIRHFTLQLQNSDVVVGLNTSAFLHARLLGKPCLVAACDGAASVTAKTRHLKQLIEKGILEVYSFDILETYAISRTLNSKEATLSFLGIQETSVANRFATLISNLLN